MAKKGYRVIGDDSKGAFKFQLAGAERVWQLPLMSALPVKQARKLVRLSHADDEQAMDAVIELLDALVPGLTDELTLDGLAEVIGAWSEASGITAGESGSSAD